MSCSGVTVDMFGDASLIIIMIGVVTGVSVDVLAGVMAALEFAIISEPFKEFSCSAACDCWPLPLLDCARVLQTWMPAYHVWSSLVLPAPPQCLNQEPPRPQQLCLPDFLMEPHLGHTELLVVVVVGSAGVYV